MDKHTVYYTVLEALQTAMECPLCRLEEKAQQAYFNAILYEAVNDPKVRIELAKSHGYCYRHAHFLVEMRDSLGVAILYQNQLNLLADSLSGKERLDLKRTVQKDSINKDCPACRNQKETRQRYVAVLLENLREPEITAAYQNSPGFCMPHLSIIIENTTDLNVQNYFHDLEKQKLARLGDELQEFIRKHDYRFANEPFGKESDSWLRVINKLNGNKVNF